MATLSRICYSIHHYFDANLPHENNIIMDNALRITILGIIGVSLRIIIIPIERVCNTHSSTIQAYLSGFDISMRLQHLVLVPQLCSDRP